MEFPCIGINKKFITNICYSLWTSVPFCDIVCATKKRRQYIWYGKDK